MYSAQRMLVVVATLTAFNCLLTTVASSSISLARRRVTSSSPHSGSSACDFDFKVYVYPLHRVANTLSSVRLAEEARRNSSYHVCVGCIYEQFALEYIMMDFFTQFCGRTDDPNEADFFYLPIVRDVEFRVEKLKHNNKKPSLTEHALLRALEKNDTAPWRKLFGVTDHFWHRNGGADHIIVMPAPVTNLRHESSRRGFFHYMPQLHAPIFLNIEYSRSFVSEYPMCAQFKNIVMPYPSVDPAVISGHVKRNKKLTAEVSPGLELELASNSSAEPGRYGKSLLLFYRGGNHGECMVIRQALTRLMVDLVGKGKAGKGGGLSTATKHKTGYLNSVFCPVPVGDSPSSKRMYDAMHVGCIPVILSDDLVWAYSSATGGSLQPQLFSITMPQKVVLMSVMQLYLSVVQGGEGGRGEGDEGDATDAGRGEADESSSGAGHTQQHEDHSKVLEALARTLLPASQLSLRHVVDMAVAEASAAPSPDSARPITMATNALEAILRLVPPRDVVRLQENVRRFAPSYHYYAHNSSQVANPLATKVLPTGGAIKHMASQLSALKRRGTMVIAQKCREEKAQRHEYVGTYPCDKEGGGEGKPKKKGGGSGGKGNGKGKKKQKRKKTSVNADKDERGGKRGRR